jgi:hypothetical protein
LLAFTFLPRGNFIFWGSLRIKAAFVLVTLNPLWNGGFPASARNSGAVPPPIPTLQLANVASAMSQQRRSLAVTPLFLKRILKKIIPFFLLVFF